MDSYKQTISTWNRFVQQYADRFMDLDLYIQTYEALNAVLDPSLPVLELGCGPGIITRHILAAHPSIRMLATDGAPAMVELARRMVPGPEYAVLDFRQLSTLEGSFGTLIAGFCLPYLAPEAAAPWISALHEKLEPGGWLYFSFPDGDPAQSGYRPASDGGEGMHMYFYPPTMVRMWLTGTGFYIEKEWTVRMKRENGALEEHLILLARRPVPGAEG